MGFFDIFKSKKLTPAENIDDATLKLFMYNLPRYVWGWGGYEEVETEAMNFARGNKDRLKIYYKKKFYFPFKQSEADDNIEGLHIHWQIENASQIHSRIEELKTELWKDYKALFVTSAIHIYTLSYSARYMTETEVLKSMEDIVLLVRPYFQSWESYFEDFQKGCDYYYQSSWANNFKTAARQMMEGNYSIYKIINW